MAAVLWMEKWLAMFTRALAPVALDCKPNLPQTPFSKALSYSLGQC